MRMPGGHDAALRRVAQYLLLPGVLALVTAAVLSQQVAHSQAGVREYAENGTTTVASFTAHDDEGTVLAWSLTGVDGGDFMVDHGVVTFRRPPDYENPTDFDLDNRYEFSVNVTDGVNTTSARMTVVVVNMNEDGVMALSSLQPEVGVPLTATLADPDGALSEVAWRWHSSMDGTTAWMAIEGAGSETYVPAAGDLGRQLRVTVTYTDDEGPGKGASSTSHFVVRESHSPGHGPEFPDSETGSRSIPENTAAGTNVGAPISALDEEGHVLTYTLGGVDAATFDLVRSSGQLVTRRPLDHETRDIYTMTLTASDPTNAHDTVEVAITVTNVEEEGTLTMSTPQPHVGERLYAYLDDPDGEIVEGTWQWETSTDRSDWVTTERVATGMFTPELTEIGSYLRATVWYTDGEGPDKRARVVSLNPVHELETNHAPTFPATETGVREMAENTPPGVPIGNPFTAIDDHDHVLTYSLQGADAGSFEIGTTTGQLFTSAPLDHEQKALYSVTVTVHDGEDAHGSPDHSSDATLSAIIIVTDVEEGLPPGPCVDGGAVDNLEDNVALASECEILLLVREGLAGDAALNWSEDISMTEWDGVSHGGSPPRVTGLRLAGLGLSGTIPSELLRLNGLEVLDLSDNLLTGPIPVWLGDLGTLRELGLAGNRFPGCVPGELRRVEVNDLSDLSIPHCDVLLGGMNLSPGHLNERFDPYRTGYTAVAFSSRVTVRAVGQPGASHQFLDNLSRPQVDADNSLPGHQVEVGAGVTFTRVMMVSADAEATLTYTVLLANGGLFTRYDADGNRVIDRDEVLQAVRDYFDGLIGRDEVIGLVQLYFFEA